jgi:hypothetical protein
MKSVKLEMSEDELLFFRQGVFKADDEIVVFSLEEFLKFRRALKKYLREANQIVEYSRNNKSSHGATVDAQRILNWVKKAEEEIKKLDKTDVQKDLFS